MCVCVYLSRVCVCRGWRRTAKGTHIRRILEYGPVEYVCHGVDTHTKCAPDNNIHIHMHTHLSISLSLHLNVQKGGLYQYHANHWLFVVFVLFPFLLLLMLISSPFFFSSCWSWAFRRICSTMMLSCPCMLRCI
jgi:hypothetical protein